MIIKNNKVEGNYCQYQTQNRVVCITRYCCNHISDQSEISWYSKLKTDVRKKKKPWPISIMSYMAKPNHVGDGPQLQKATKQS